MNTGPRTTLRHLAVVFGGRVSFVALSFFGTALVLRTLDTSAAGMYWMCVAISKLVTGCLGDSLDFAVLRTVPLDWDTNRTRALDALRAAFWVRIGFVCLVLAVACAGLRTWSRLLFKTPDLSLLILLTGAAIVGEMLVRSAMGFYQALQQFNRLVLLDVVLQTSRFAGVMLLVALHHLSAAAAVAVYATAPFAAFAAAYLYLPPDVRRVCVPSVTPIADVFHYSKWMIAVLALAAIYDRLDVILLGYFRNPAEVGLYAPAVMLALTPELLVSVVLTVLNPQVSPSYEQGRFAHLLRSYRVYAAPLGVAAIAGAVLIGGPLIRLIFGMKYAVSIDLFKILAVGTLVFGMITPLRSALLCLIAPHRALLVAVSGLVLTFAAGIAVIPHYGATGTAVLMTGVRISMALLIIGLAQPLVQRQKAVMQTAVVP